MNRIAAGTNVSWFSSSNGCTTTKRGVVLGFLPAGRNVLEYCGHVTAKSRIKVSEDTYVSSVDRYAVECLAASDLPVVYAPRASVVESQNPEPTP